MRILIAALALPLSAAPALAGGPRSATDRMARASWFACDGVDGPLAASFAPRDPQGTSIVTLHDRDTHGVTASRVTVGSADPGAGQVYYPLSRGGKAVGTIHMVNPGMVGNPVLPAVTSVDLDGHHLECRFMPDMRFLGIGEQRSVMVRGEGAALRYESFDYRTRGPATHPDGVHRSNAPSLSIPDGAATATGYRFTNARVAYSVDRRQVVARLGDRTIANDGFFAWEAAPIRATTAIGADAVWPAGRSFTGCRGDLSNAALHDCLIGAMKAGGATPAALAFTERLASRRDFGFMTGWRQAGAVGIATITYPWRANSNEAQAIVPATGDPIFVDEYRMTAADKARGDWRRFVAAHPQAFPVTPATVANGATGDTIIARYRLATCRACAALGEMTVVWRFAGDGRLIGARVERISA